MRKISSLVFSLLLVVCTISAAAQRKKAAEGGTGDTSQFRNLLQQVYDAWSDLDPSKAAKFYAKDAGLTFFDIKPMKYTGWAEYAAGVPNAFSDYSSGKFTMGDDLEVHRHGNLTWATCTWTGDLTKKDGTHEDAAGRHTIVWEKRGKDWLIAHEHMSVPLQTPR